MLEAYAEGPVVTKEMWAEACVWLGGSRLAASRARAHINPGPSWSSMMAPHWKTCRYAGRMLTAYVSSPCDKNGGQEPVRGWVGQDRPPAGLGRI